MPPMHRTGTVYLPLHPGRAPPWLFGRMVELGGLVSEYIVEEYGQQALLERLAHPDWFQAFGCVLGFDWHSSGVTTTTCGALKIALEQREIGVKVAGGKGRTSRKAPEEITRIGEGFNFSTQRIEDSVKASRLTAKVDNSCIQDTYQLYHHCFFLGEKGDFSVIQQGMSAQNKYARRYHWLNPEEFFNSEKENIACEEKRQEVLNLASPLSEKVRKLSIEIVQELPKNEEIIRHLPSHHEIGVKDLSKHDWAVLQQVHELQPQNYEELLLFQGMGPKKLRALALTASLIYGSEPDWQDPVKYSFAHGGKDGFPYPVDRETYDASIGLLREAVEQTKLKQEEKARALRRLSEFIQQG